MVEVGAGWRAVEFRTLLVVTCLGLLLFGDLAGHEVVGQLLILLLQHLELLLALHRKVLLLLLQQIVEIAGSRSIR